MTGWCGLAGCLLPVVQAPIGGAASPRLASAVAAAGGLGSLALTWKDVVGVRRALRECRALSTGAINANFVLDFPVDHLLDAALNEGVEAASFFWGHDRGQIERTRAAGACAIVVVGGVNEAKRALDGGADVIVAQGIEAGGHVRGETPLAALLPAILAIAGATPVLAAGGIATSDDSARARRLGAAGIWVGTRFVASVEADAHPAYKAAIIAARSDATALSALFDGGWPDADMRTLVNSTLTDWVAAGRPPPGARPGEGGVIGTTDDRPVPRYDSDAPIGRTTGDIEAMALYAGTGVGNITTIDPAAAIVAELGRPWRDPPAIR